VLVGSPYSSNACSGWINSVAADINSKPLALPLNPCHKFAQLFFLPLTDLYKTSTLQLQIGHLL